MLKLKLQYFDHLMQRADSLGKKKKKKKNNYGENWRQKEKGAAEDKMIR